METPGDIPGSLGAFVLPSGAHRWYILRMDRRFESLREKLSDYGTNVLRDYIKERKIAREHLDISYARLGVIVATTAFSDDYADHRAIRGELKRRIDDLSLEIACAELTLSQYVIDPSLGNSEDHDDDKCRHCGFSLQAGCSHSSGIQSEPNTGART